MSEQTSRDEAVRVGAEGLLVDGLPVVSELREAEINARLVLEAARKAGVIHWADEWREIGPDSPASVNEALFVRRVSFEAGEEVNEELGR